MTIKNATVGLLTGLATIASTKEASATITPDSLGHNLTTEHVMTTDSIASDTMPVNEVQDLLQQDKQLVGGFGFSLGQSYADGLDDDFLFSVSMSHAGTAGFVKGHASLGIPLNGHHPDSEHQNGHLHSAELRFGDKVGAGYEFSNGFHSLGFGIGEGRGLPYIGGAYVMNGDISGPQLELLSFLTGKELGIDGLNIQAKVLLSHLTDKTEQDKGLMLRYTVEAEYAVTDNTNIYLKWKDGFVDSDLNVSFEAQFEIGARGSLWE